MCEVVTSANGVFSVSSVSFRTDIQQLINWYINK